MQQIRKYRVSTLLLVAAPALLLLLLRPVESSAVASLGPYRGDGDSRDEPPCDDSFPLAASGALDDLARRRLRGSSIPTNANWGHDLRLAVPSDPTRRSHAPLCPRTDPPRIDVRRLLRCDPNQCFVQTYQSCLHITSFECKSRTDQPTPGPTARPTSPSVKTVHPVELKLRGVPEGYHPSPEVRATVLKFASEVLREGLQDGLKFQRVEYAGRLKSYGRGAAYVAPIALSVTVRGPADVSNYALSYIMEVIRLKFDELEASLRNIASDSDFFTDLNLGLGHLDLADIIVGSTEPPTPAPTSKSLARTPKVEEDSFVILEKKSGGFPWWAWLLLLLVVISVVLCLWTYCQRAGATRQVKDQKSAHHIWLHGETDDDPKMSERKGRTQRHRLAIGNNDPVRNSRHQAPVKKQLVPAPPKIKRVTSQTEIEEEERKRNDGAKDPFPTLYQINGPSASDPPQENASVPYSQRSSARTAQRRRDEEEPSGYKIPIKASMYASEAMGWERHGGVEEGVQGHAEDPEGAKVSRKKSMYASEVLEDVNKEKRGSQSGRGKDRRRKSDGKPRRRPSAAERLRSLKKVRPDPAGDENAPREQKSGKQSGGQESMFRRIYKRMSSNMGNSDDDDDDEGNGFAESNKSFMWNDSARDLSKPGGDEGLEKGRRPRLKTEEGFRKNRSASKKGEETGGKRHAETTKRDNKESALRRFANRVSWQLNAEEEEEEEEDLLGSRSTMYIGVISPNSMT
ncbi:hypothetical protein ACHAWF_012384 [Thalassiosira exigua]